MRNDDDDTRPRRRHADPLSLKIYTALLGDSPRIERAPPAHRPRLKMRVRLEATLEHEGVSPFRTPSLREHLERCVGYAARAIDEARARIAAAKPAEPAPPASDAPPRTKPIVLIGPAARRRLGVVGRTRAA